MAAPILSYEGLGLVQGEGWLFRGLDIYVGQRDRLALIGRNGAGKTTLLKCLVGLIDPDEGKRTIVPGTNVVLLEQDPPMSGFETLRDWVLGGERAPEGHEAAAIADQLVGVRGVVEGFGVLEIDQPQHAGHDAPGAPEHQGIELELKQGAGLKRFPGSAAGLVVDDPHRPVQHLAERITAVRSRRQWPIAAVQSTERADHLRKFLTGRIEPILICDLASGRKSELRTATYEYQKAIACMDSRLLGERINV